MLEQLSEELVAAYGDLRRFLMRQLGDRELAADLAQTSFERTYAYVASTPVASARAVLFRTARNLCVDKFRRDRLLQWESLDAQPGEAGRPGAASNDRSPEHVAVDRNMLDHVGAVIDGLPPRCREAFVLSRVHGLSHEEIARELGITRSAVEKHVMRGLHACRALLEK